MKNKLNNIFPASTRWVLLLWRQCLTLINNPGHLLKARRDAGDAIPWDAQWEMYSGAKHGVTYLMNRAIDPENKDRAPRCQSCHMPDGDHRVFSAWGFLAVRLPEADPEWMGYRTTILKGLGVLDPEGNPTGRLDVVKAGKIARLTKEEFQAERKRFTDICTQCHCPNFVNENMKNADLMVKEA